MELLAYTFDSEKLSYPSDDPFISPFINFDLLFFEFHTFMLFLFFPFLFELNFFIGSVACLLSFLKAKEFFSSNIYFISSILFDEPSFIFFLEDFMKDFISSI